MRVAMQRMLRQPRSIQAAFRNQVLRSPSAIALRTRERALSYAELDGMSDTCAAALRSVGAGPGRHVGMLLPRSPEAVISMLGILKTGAAFVSFDTAYPPATLAAMVLECAPVALLADWQHPSHVPDLVSFGDAPILDLTSLLTRKKPESNGHLIHDDPEMPAYVMYTSGSTGQPKGVVVPHRGVLRLVVDADYVSLGPDEVILQLAPLGFDACIFEIFAALLTGGTLAVDTAQPVSLDGIADAISSFGVTTLWLTAGLFHLMVDQRPDALRGLRQLLAGGDVLSPAHVRRMLQLAPACRLINGYGPTENTVFTCCYTVPCDWKEGDGVAIGLPINGSVVHILDDDLLPVADGEPGELCTSGQGVALGYLNRAEQTAHRFVDDRDGASEARMYRTGDLARRRSDGIIEFVGRVDRQVKINGKRVEPEGIETALRSAAGVCDCIVVLGREGAAKAILAFVVAVMRPGLEGELARHVATLLPSWMCPSRIIVLDALPLTPNGKVDRRALVRMVPVEAPAQMARSELEQDLARIWAQVLRLSELDRNRNFADLGGTSLQMMALQDALARELGRNVPMLELFAHPTVSTLAAYLAGSKIGLPKADTRERAERQGDALRRLSSRMKLPVPARPSRNAP